MAVDIADLERRARQLLAPGVYDYFAGGLGQERTLRASVRAWGQYWLAPRVLRDVSAVDASVRLPGHPQTLVATPVAVAPTGFQGLALGARAVFPGRPVLWALACGGTTGVRDLLAGMTGDLAHVMALAGTGSVAEIPEMTGPPTSNSLDT